MLCGIQPCRRHRRATSADAHCWDANRRDTHRRQSSGGTPIATPTAGGPTPGGIPVAPVAGAPTPTAGPTGAFNPLALPNGGGNPTPAPTASQQGSTTSSTGEVHRVRSDGQQPLQH